MLYVITGDDTVSSRKKMSELLELSSDIVRLDGKKATIAEIEMALVSNALFSQKKSIVVEYFSKVKSDRFLEVINRTASDSLTEIILWDEAELSAKNKTAFKLAQSFSFAFPKVYFSFMDSLAPGQNNSLKVLGEVLKTYEPEQILYSIIKRIRQLLILKSNNFMEFEEFAKMQEWQIGKLRSQANKWTEEELEKAFLKYTELDKKVKTSGLTMPLAKHLDITLANDLN